MPHSMTDQATPTGQHATKIDRSSRGLGLLFTVAGLIGLIAAVVLLVEKIALTENPDYVPTCSINPVLSCGSVMLTPQAAAFGIPNPIIGIAGFAAVAVVGAAVLAGARFAGWFWVGIQAAVTFAIVFVHWLIFQSLFVIGALCPYCMIVWAVTIPIFWHTTVHNLSSLQRDDASPGSRTITLLQEYRGAILTAWYILVIALIAWRFWDYWTTVL